MSSNAQHIFLIQSNQIMFPHMISSPLYIAMLTPVIPNCWSPWTTYMRPLTRRSRRKSASWNLAVRLTPSRTNAFLENYLTMVSKVARTAGSVPSSQGAVWVSSWMESSGPTPFLFGVAQGTVVGLLLILICINDMPSQVSKGTCIRLFRRWLPRAPANPECERPSRSSTGPW